MGLTREFRKIYVVVETEGSLPHLTGDGAIAAVTHTFVGTPREDFLSLSDNL